jgi:phosphatidate cytidylyltransferase
MADTTTTAAPSKALVFIRRSGSTLLLWGVVAAAFMSMRMWAYLGLIGLLTVVATYEYFQMLRAGGVKCCAKFGIGLAVVYSGVVYAGMLGVTRLDLAGWDLCALGVALGGAFVAQMRAPIRGVETLVAVTTTVCGFVYVALLFNFTAKILSMHAAWQVDSGMVAVPAAFVFLWLLAVTKFTDMGAYIVGSLIGRHKMIPQVSPGKTWEGFGGAIAFSQLAGCGLYALFPQQLAVLGGWGHVVFLACLLALLAVLGDLAESVVKRSLNAKDSGRMLPGIGGALDLIDSICFTAPALYYYLLWILPPAT